MRNLGKYLGHFFIMLAIASAIIALGTYALVQGQEPAAGGYSVQGTVGPYAIDLSISPMAAQALKKGTAVAGYQPRHKFGLIPTKPADKAKALKLRRYLAQNLALPPAAVNWYAKCSWDPQLWGNNQYGDCTCAGMAAIVCIQTTYNGAPVVLPTQDVVNYYFRLSGGWDSGLDLQTVLADMQTNGIDGHKWGPWVSVDPTNATEVQQAVSLFGAVYIGIALPRAWDEDTSAWTVGGANTVSVGGHCVVIAGYDQAHWDIYTWSQVVPTDQAALSMVCDEAYAMVNPDWIATGTAPSGFDLPTLMGDLQAMGQPTGNYPQLKLRKPVKLETPGYHSILAQ